MSYKTILAILDTADNSRAAADFAFALAAENDAHVIGLHAETISAVPLVAPMEIPDPVALQALQDMAQAETIEVERIFRQKAERFRRIVRMAQLRHHDGIRFGAADRERP